MSLHTLGNVSLNISTGIYFIWFIPQLLLTFKRRSTKGLSLWMHAILMTGYLSDLIYGFGRNFPLQYRLVTVCGLLYLVIQHVQLYLYTDPENKNKILYLMSVYFLAFFVFALLVIPLKGEHKMFYDWIGMLSTLCWFTYLIPQLYKNYKNKSTNDLSRRFVLLVFVAAVCDMISAYALGWDWPSLVGTPISVLKNMILLMQIRWYASSTSRSQFEKNIDRHPAA